jgi:hypothetical protein
LAVRRQPLPDHSNKIPANSGPGFSWLLSVRYQIQL